MWSPRPHPCLSQQVFVPCGYMIFLLPYFLLIDNKGMAIALGGAHAGVFIYNYHAGSVYIKTNIPMLVAYSFGFTLQCMNPIDSIALALDSKSVALAEEWLSVMLMIA